MLVTKQKYNRAQFGWSEVKHENEHPCRRTYMKMKVLKVFFFNSCQLKLSEHALPLFYKN